MSESNYGDKNLQIRIPIEIVPDIKDIKKGIREIQGGEKGRISQGRFEEARRLGAFDEVNLYNSPSQGIYETGATFPLRTHPILHGNGGPNDIAKVRMAEIKTASKLVAGSAPLAYRLGQVQPSGIGTAAVPVGGGAPAGISKSSFQFRPNRQVGVGVYDPGDPPDNPLANLFNKALGGPAKAQQAIALLRNPLGLIKMLATNPITATILAALVAVEVAKVIIKELVRKGSIYDRTFKNLIFTRFEALRTREVQQRILVGFGDTAQIITTTSAGTTNPRDAYNTYEVFNRNQMELQEKFAIRNDRGYGP